MFLRNFVQLLNCAVDLLNAAILLAARKADFAHEFGGGANIRHEPRQQRARILGNADGRRHDLHNIRRRLLALFRKGTDFRRDHAKAFAVFLRPRRLNRRIQRQHAGLAADVFDDGDFLRNLPHGLHGILDGLPAYSGIFCGFGRQLLGFDGVVRVLADIRGHLLHRRRNLLGRSGLRRRALRHVRRADAD